MAVVKLKRSSVPNKAPLTTDLELGELAINTYDGRVYVKKNNGAESIIELGTDATRLIQDSSHRLVTDLQIAAWEEKQDGLNSTVDIAFKDAVVYGTIIPDQSNARNIGSETNRFKEAWIDTLHIASNTLYLGETSVLGTDTLGINLQGNLDQNVIVKANGSGIAKLLSSAGSEVIATGSNADAKLQATGTGGRVVLGSNTEIQLTAPDITINGNIGLIGNQQVQNLTVTGIFTVSGTTTSVNSTNMDIKDNIVLLNSGEANSGVSLGTAGLRIDRGQLVDELLVFDESSQKWKTGPYGGTLNNIATESYVDSGLSKIVQAPVIKDENVALTHRSNLNFTGSSVTVVDDEASDTLNVSISGGNVSINLDYESQFSQFVVPTSSITTVYTASTAKKQLKDIMICNQSSTTSSFIDLALVLNGETLSAKNYILKSYEVKPNETLHISCKTILPINSTIQMLSTQSTSCCINGNVGSNLENTTFLAQDNLTTSMASIFTASQKTLAKEIILCNNTANAVTVDIAVVQSGDSLGTKNYIFKSLEVLANDTKYISTSLMIGINGSIYMSASSANSISTTISGII
jgi:hypothetical protein